MKKIITYSLLIVSTIVLNSCINEKNSNKTQVVLTGDYAASGFTLGTFTDLGATLNLTSTTAKFTCHNGYSVFASTTPTFGNNGNNMTCNRQGGCDLSYLYLANNNFANYITTESEGTSSLDSINGSGGIGVACVKNGQETDWT